ncbi:hypothetical protein NQ318_005487 [Aromia moschata]|uniref:Cytochrome P450 n=1 Tax=Aromia moschata TaxID=1265417 RepID=A0AAV8XP66_9CUCU|nr:hypothetical protein NQ318_005487 [Aromia moschata]
MLLTDVLLLDVLSVITAILAVGYAYLKWTQQYWKRKGVPYIEPSPLFGGSKSEVKNARDGAVDIYKTAKANGWRHVGIYRLTNCIYIPIDVELVKHILTKDFGYFIDRGLYVNERDDPLGVNLFFLSGQKWRNLRAKLSPTFTSGKLKAMFQTLVDCGLVMEKYIDENVNISEPVDIKEILANFSTDIIGTCAFGIDCNSFKEPNSPFRATSKRFFFRTKLERYKSAIAMTFPKLARALRIVINNPEVSSFYGKVVEDTIHYRLKNNVRRKDLLQMLIDMMIDEKNQEDGQSDGGLTMTEIAAQCFLFFIAGFETSSTTMTFALFELAKHPKCQEKVRDELKRVLAKHGDQVTYDALGDMKYMSQVIDETLRLYPPLATLMRQCVKDYKVPGEDVVIEKGTKVLIPVLGPQMDEEFYENPKEFNPDRFDEDKRKKIPQYAHLPFGEGPRICIGERFGVMESKVGLTCILRNFKVSLNEKTKLPMKLDPRNLIPAVEGGVWLNLHKLESKI